MIEFQDAEEENGGGAGWLATFADLMSLLMCFFVLLLSFSEMDLEKYKQIAGSMKAAFGVQDKIDAQSIPKGTSILAEEFSPGMPTPTPVDVIQQQTTDSSKQTLDVLDRERGTQEDKQTGDHQLSEEEAAELLEKRLEELVLETEADAKKLAEALREEIIKGMIDVNSAGRSITIRIREFGSFRSASAELHTQFVPILEKIRKVLLSVEGQISVEGHTDSIPISTPLFKSNWGLSASRALAVIEHLRLGGEITDARFLVVGHAANNPLEDNSTAENRAANRRVEIIIRQGMDEDVSKALEEIQKSNPAILDQIDFHRI